MNKTILMGRLTKDPEVKYLQDENSTAMARYTLAVDRRYRKDGKAETDFISCVTFGKNAEFAEKYLQKGLKILVSGRIQTGSYVNQEGNKVYTINVIVEDYLRNYYDKRNAVAESYAYGTQKAKNTNLKQFAETIRFLEEQDVRTPEQLTEKIQEFDTQLKEVSQRLKKQLAALQRVNVNLYAMKEYFETRPVYLELKNKYFGREKFKEEHKKELSGYYRSERILKENLDPSGKIPEGQWKREAASLSEEIAALRKEDKQIHAMLRKYEEIKNNVEALMAEEGEGVSLPETNKREQSTETKEAVRTMKRKKKHHGMEL